MKRRKKLPLIKMIEPLSGGRIRLFFSTGKIVEHKFAVKSTKHAKIVARGLGLDPAGNGRDLAADVLHERKALQVWVR